MPERPAPDERPPFRRRLLVTFGAATGAVLAALGGALCLAAYGWLLHDAQGLLEREAAEVGHEVVTATGQLDAARYAWDEPHHVFADARIDPYFLQVFDARGRLLQASGNIARLPAYPPRLLPATAGGLTPLATFRANGRRLYRVTAPLRDPSGRVVGHVQLAGQDPRLGRTLGRIALAVFGGLAAVFLALLGVVGAVGRRVVRPLEQITAHARALSAPTLGARVPVPDDGDRETVVLARTLNDALDRFERSFEEVRRFTADAAHQLQTPLTVLLGHVDVALRRERKPEAYRATLRLLHQEVDGLVHTLRGLLALARLDDASGVLPTESVDVAALARAEVDAVRPLAEAKGLAIRVMLRPARARGHPDLLRDVVGNLLDNALKYTGAGAIVVSVERAGGEVRLVVEDTGKGIAPEHLARATDRFWRADTVRQLPGSGLGLALVQRVVERHGGRLELTSAPGSGTRAVVTLPEAGVGFAADVGPDALEPPPEGAVGT